ncbi:unnamed protein product [Cuscuta epithymum]|uniref:Uncharacterized protein n=1 Tax=Cuscuta epithymum TaxID=186058 RepID=A0AAV0CNN6_9ASTE|nr:unnamed protein product [Cuscuta epithymum]
MEKPNESPPIDDYSPKNTLITFKEPIPLLRGPVSTEPKEGEPIAGRSFTLAFRDPISWESAYRNCEHQITQQCETGVRIGCSIAASHKCQPPWWKAVFGGGVSKQDLAERQKCEELEMEACLREAKEKCVGYARDKCSRAFLDARICVTGAKNPNLNWKEVSKLISCVNLADKNLGTDLLRLQRPWVDFKTQLEVTCRGRDLLGPDTANFDDF